MTSDAPNAQGLLLQLAAPLQSWGEHSRFTHKRDTAPAPTRSALIGLISAALGRRRDEPCDDLAALGFTVRIDRPGTRMRDLHTVGGGLPRHLTVATAEGKRRPGDTGTLLSHRYYLQDAVFTVAATATDDALLERCAQALRRPEWPPYLGRRSCPPSGPLLLTGPVPEAERRLLHLPLARPAPHDSGKPAAGRTVAVGFTSDRPLDGLAGDTVSEGSAHIASEAQDDPVSFAPLDRRYRTRPVHRITLQLPAGLCGGYGADYLEALHDYLAPDHRTEVS
ncbi:type I-E CRISPR-associated protein Cas5/CasD [Streptomyces sp. JJ36]|uniref:type I-E CRISPR-associated protein Cas5/CasD n=1 Tax=Streptomyces sp. JJ36 TaxID=2736645 RepID=UPI001F029F9B|nr:type I-E CRISPR-associated protein Cas5/CasD [Streptomyces sp. JJ36]MCF6523772.1 type I-E CRISPR-associated protein Cas5/CasD [Streptomyces sp. JJ36]